MTVADAAARHPDVFETIAGLIAAETGVPAERLRPEARFEELGLTSMDVVVVLAAVEERFGIYLPMDGAIAGARDLGGFCDGVAEHLAPADG